MRNDGIKFSVETAILEMRDCQPATQIPLAN